PAQQSVTAVKIARSKALHVEQRKALHESVTHETSRVRRRAKGVMKYLHVVEREGRYVSELRESDVPVPQGEEVLVRVAASGLNRADLSQIAGRYPPPLGESDILGLEVSGTIDGSDHRVRALLAGGGHCACGAATPWTSCSIRSAPPRCPATSRCSRREAGSSASRPWAAAARPSTCRC